MLLLFNVKFILFNKPNNIKTSNQSQGVQGKTKENSYQAMKP
jgi:hypothetical protein